MNQIFSSMMVFSGILLISSCAGSKVEEVKKVEEPDRDVLVARVASVNKEQNYVLIQRFGRLVIPEDSVLYALGSRVETGGSAASIKLTGEKLGQFLAADVLMGELVVGDAVYLRTFEAGKVPDKEEIKEDEEDKKEEIPKKEIKKEEDKKEEIPKEEIKEEGGKKEENLRP